MALPILDGNQSATTLSSILTSGEHIPAHTVVSLGTQAITDMRGAVSGSVVSISNFPATQTVAGTVTAIGQANGTTLSSLFPIGIDTLFSGVRPITDLYGYRLPVSLGDSNAVVSASLSDPLPAGTNRIGVVTIGAGTVTIGAGTAQIGSVTASISGTVPISISSVTVGNSVTIGSLPLIAGTVTANVPLSDISGGITDYISGADSFVVSPLGGVTFPISGTVTANTFALQGTAVTTSNFTSTTPSTILASANSGREVLTIFNEGAGNLHICAGATCTTIAYQVRLSAGDYYEVPLNQTSLTHSAVFATAGTARVTQVS